MTLVLAAVLAVGAVCLAQVKEVRSYKREMDISRHGDRLVLTTSFPEVFTKRLRHRLSSGFASRILVEVVLEAHKRKTPLAQGLMQYTILYDIWEEKFHVRQEGPRKQRDYVLPSMEAVIETCASIDSFPLAPLIELPRDVRARIKVRITVNPVSRELRRNVREYLANPDGSGHMGSPRSFFGSFSRIFVNEKELQADAVYTYRSPRFELPRE